MCSLKRATMGGFACAAVFGSVAIQACADRSTSATVVVSQVTLSPSAATVRAGETVSLQARAVDASGNAVTVPTITWSSSNKSIATVSTSGVVTAIAAGDARIAASAFG